MVKNLQSKKEARIATDRIAISNGLAEYLSKAYGIKGRFVKCTKFLEDFQINQERYENEKYFSVIKTDSFFYKVIKA